MDKKLLTEEVIDNLVADSNKHNENEELQLNDWLFANQLTKDNCINRKLGRQPIAIKIYWYYQARLRWTVRPQPDSEKLLSKIEKKIEKEQPEVQGAMSFTTGWIGAYEKMY